MTYTEYTGRSGTYIGPNDGGGGLYVDELVLITKDNLIPVIVTANTASETPGMYPRQVNFKIAYYQVDDFTKKIIYVRMTFGKGTNDPRDTSYRLQLNYFALGYMALILNFAYPVQLFIVMFFFLGCVLIGLGAFFWVLNRVCTQLLNPPELKLWSMLSLVAPPAAAGTFLGIILVGVYLSIGNYFINGKLLINPQQPDVEPLGMSMFDVYQYTFNNVGEIGVAVVMTDTEMAQTRIKRIGLVFWLVACSCFSVCCKMYFPRPETKKEKEIARQRIELANKEDIWDPIMWKKSTFLFSAWIIGLQCIVIVEISFWGMFGDLQWYIIIMLIFFGIFNDTALEGMLQEALLWAPHNAANAFFQGVVTYGSPNFLAFVICDYVGVAMQLVERFYLDAIMNTVYTSGEMLLAFIFDQIKKYTPKYLAEKKDEKKKKNSKSAVEAKKRELDVADGEEENAGDSVEPIVDSYKGIAIDGQSIYFTPYMVFLWMQYREQIGIPGAYNIRQSDMLIYMMFQLCLIPFQPFFDIFNHACNELFWGWKTYEYLVYSRYRFLQRETRWKGMENTLDECIEEDKRTLDQMCFSSQFYFMVTIGLSGIMFFAFGYEVMKFSGYNVFADWGMIYLVIYMSAIHVIYERAVIFIGWHLKVWKIKHENTEWHLKLAEEDELDIPDWEDVKGASHEAYLMNQRITSETFRYKFLNYNRTWIINQLPQLLTPRTLRRSRPYLINQIARILNARRDDISDDSDVEHDKKFGPVSLNNSSRNIIRWWLGQARRRIRLRSIVDPLIRRARGTDCQQCLSRKQLQVEYEIDVDKMAQMYTNAFPDDEEIDQVQWKNFWNTNQKYTTICLACLSKRKEKNLKELMKSGTGFESIMYDDEQEAYPEWGPVYLSAASKAILLNWYRKAQRVRQAKKGVNRRAPKVAKGISDDEGDDTPATWTKQLLSLTPATKAIATKWIRTARAAMLKRAGKGASLRESQLGLVPIDETEKFSSGKKSLTLRK